AGPAHCGLRLGPCGLRRVREASPCRAAAAVTGGSDEGGGARLDREPERREQRGGGAAVLAPGADQPDGGAVRVLLPDPGGGRPVSRATTVFRQDRVDQGTWAVRDGGVPRGRPGDLEVRLAGRLAHRCAVHDRARQDHRLEAGVVEAAGPGGDPSARALSTPVTLARPSTTNLIQPGSSASGRRPNNDGVNRRRAHHRETRVRRWSAGQVYVPPAP